MVLQTFPAIVISMEKFYSSIKLNKQEGSSKKTVYNRTCKINKKFQEPKQNDKNNLSKKELIQAFDHFSDIPLGTWLYQHISPEVILQGNIELHL